MSIFFTIRPEPFTTDAGICCVMQCSMSRFGRMPPLVGVSYCRPGIHGVAPTVRQQDTPTRGSCCAGRHLALCTAMGPRAPPAISN